MNGGPAGAMACRASQPNSSGKAWSTAAASDSIVTCIGMAA